MDNLTREHRSWNMSRIRPKDTKPELVVRSTLHRLGARFRLHRRDLPGNPDIVLPKYRLIVLVHGCFWHRHPDCRYAYIPKSRQEFWSRKFEKNVARDQQVRTELARLEWNVEVVWECETRELKLLEYRLSQLLATLREKCQMLSNAKRHAN